LPGGGAREPWPGVGVAETMRFRRVTLSAAWDARVAYVLGKVPPRLRCAVVWLRAPERFPLRIGVACLLILGGLLSVLPVLGLWMLPLGLALLADDIPRLKPPLERAVRRVEAAWRRVRGRSP
jgi:hypothetical protein